VSSGGRDRSLLIAGFGNPMMGDDGIGPAVIRLLSGSLLPAAVTCLELSDVLHLPAAWSGQDEVWMVDAVLGGAPPGTIHRVFHEDILSLAHDRTTVHHLGLGEGLRWVLHAHPEMAGVGFSLWGVEPESVAPIEALSAVAGRAVVRVANEISVAVRALTGGC
jgi:hydrogenase maturation protease